MANIQNIISQDLDVIPQGAGTVILRLKGSTRGTKGDTGVSGTSGGSGSKGLPGSKGDTGISGSASDETLLWMAL